MTGKNRFPDCNPKDARQPVGMSGSRLEARTRRIRRLLVAAYLMFLLALVELFAWPAGNLLQRKLLMYSPPQSGSQAISMEEYLSIRDPELGWPRKREFGQRYALDGSRWCKGTDLPVDAEWLVSLYGDSFTADWVGGDNDHWGCRMQKALGATVKNFGIGGYGTDQAFIRYKTNERDHARIVILGHMSENIIRNLTRYRDFQTRQLDWAFKPRFVLGDAGNLTLIPLPTLDEGHYRRFIGVNSPPFILPHENFAPGGAAGAVRHGFPHLVSLFQNLGYWEFRARLETVPNYGPFYDVEHPLQGVQLTSAIVLAFEREAIRRNQKSLVVIFPGPGDMHHYRKSGTWLYQNLIDALDNAGLHPYNFGPTLLQYIGARPDESAFRSHHYTQDVSHLVADSVLAELVKRGWVHPPGGVPNSRPGS